jgi:NAD(P)-dependent dehydrogenase (short-subunit alcohol dehydrogenase family)
VNNAAGNFVSRTEDLSMRGFDAVSQIVMRGGFNLTLECGKRWIEAGQKASVLSILVTWIWNGGPFVVPSAMAKSAMHSLTQSLAVEWGPKGIRLNAIAPGLFPTEGMSARLNPKGGEHRADASNPMRRAGQMPELANLAVYLMSPQAEYMTGQAIAIDGGQYNATGANFSRLSQWSDADWQKARESIEAKNKADREQRTA